MDMDSLEEGVISSSAEVSESIFETVEKKQIRVNTSKMAIADDIRKGHERSSSSANKSCPRRKKGAKHK